MFEGATQHELAVHRPIEITIFQAEQLAGGRFITLDQAARELISSSQLDPCLEGLHGSRPSILRGTQTDASAPESVSGTVPRG